jgi:hypothetical protein
MIVSKKQLFDLEVKGQGPTKVIMVHDTPPYGHAPNYTQICCHSSRSNIALSRPGSILPVLGR